MMKDPESTTKSAAAPHQPAQGDEGDHLIQFLGFRFDRRQRRLEHLGRNIIIEPKAIDLLDYLLRHRERVVSKTELLDAVWPDVLVTDSSLTTCIGKLRRALGKGDQQCLKSYYRIGYRFIATCEFPASSDDTSIAAAGDAPHATNGRDSNDSLFLGRTQEMRHLEHAWQRARGARATLVLVAGDQGIGKTRLLDEFCTRVVLPTARPIIAHCHDTDGSAAFWPWVEVVRQLTLAKDPQELRSFLSAGNQILAMLLPELAALLPTHKELPATDPAQDRFRLFDAIAALLRHEATRGPLVVVIEDLHWADKPSLLLLHFLARTLVDFPILQIATYRSDEALQSTDVADTLARLQATPHSQRITVPALSLPQIEQLARRLAGRDLPRSWMDRLYAESEGNPFVVEQLLDHLRQSGLLVDTTSDTVAWPAIGIPQVVQSLIDQRTRRLSPACRRLLAIAAVHGREFDLGILARATSATPQALAPTLAAVLAIFDEALRARLVSEIDADNLHYRFTHPMIREGLYAALSAAERSHWHWQVGAAMEAEAQLPTHGREAEIAHHLMRGVASGSVDKALLHGVRAAELASGMYAYEVAARHYRDALELLRLRSQANPAKQARLLVALAQAQSKSGDLAGADHSAQQAAIIATQIGDPAMLAEAALASTQSPFAEPAVDPDACRLLEQARASLPPDDSSLRARLLARLAWTYHHAADRGEQRRQLSAEAVVIADRLKDPSALLWALDGRHQALMDPAHNRERLAVAENMIGLATRIGDRDRLATARACRAWDLAERGDQHAAATEMVAFDGLAQQLQDPTLRWRHALWRVMEATIVGHWQEAVQRADQSLALGLALDRDYPNLVTQAQLLTINLTRWNLMGGEAVILESMVARYPQVPAFRVMLAFVLLVSGKPDAARQHCDQCLSGGIERLPWDARWLPTVGYLGEIYGALGDRARVAQIYPAVLPYADLVSLTGIHGSLCFGAIARCLGNMATVMHHWDDAEQHLRRAVAIHSEMKAEPWLALTYDDYAKMLRARARKRDQAEASRMIDEAHLIATRLEMPGLLARIGQTAH